MFVGPPSPHNPYEVPEPYASMYRPDDMPVPRTFQCDLSRKPPHQLAYKRNGRKPLNFENLTQEKLRRVTAYYYAKITLVDDQVGKIVDCLKRRGVFENTLIIFISDHGEFMGDYGMLEKSIDEYPMLYDVGLHVPFICSLPKGQRGAVVDTPVELVDLYPTIADALGLAVPPEVQGMSMLQAVCGTGPAPDRNYVFSENSSVKMLRSRTHKLVYYPAQTYGELYDLVKDPHEMANLYDSPEHTTVRNEMIKALLDRLIYTEAPLHGASLRGRAYWRYSYRKPFDDSIALAGPE